ncbi:MAG: tRNA(Met) cytidine acetyltransferase [Myxococcales bacterium]|nr:tRNA(Met) cytidine acetyltransferase [Myxococcales bacterium]MCB9534455.1 tRNA(Met) cytidine acetyltransferase [Myxococcales bacterium]
MRHAYDDDLDERHPSGRRSLVVARGAPEATRAAVLRAIQTVPLTAVAWVGEQPPLGVAACAPRELLGQSFAAVVVDLHDGVDGDALGQVAGAVCGGGALILQAPPSGQLRTRRPWASAGWAVAEAGGRSLIARVERLLKLGAAPERLAPTAFAPTGSPEQLRLVDSLSARLRQPGSSLTAVIAARGRGKSAALGLSISAAGVSALVTGPSRDAVAEVVRFARGHASWLPATDVVSAFERDLGSLGGSSPRVLVVDEAAQLPVPLLRRIATLSSGAHLVVSTTTDGYEGTGRGFELRFVDGLEASGVAVHREELTSPIRWSADDPLEPAIDDALLLRPGRRPAGARNLVAPAVPTSSVRSPTSPLDAGDAHGELACVELDRDALARDEALLREVWGLLVEAHYRTTPRDLEILLDAPNVRLFVAHVDDRVAAVNVVALEGGLDPDAAQALWRGSRVTVGHALADVLCGSLGFLEGARARLARSVRVATVPEWRRRGAASALIRYTHDAIDADVFGTLFGATPALIEFRRRLGYAPLYCAAGRGARSGEPTVACFRAASRRGEELLEAAGTVAAYELPSQLALLGTDGELTDSALASAVLDAFGRDRVRAPSLDEQRRGVERYAWGPATFEAHTGAIRAWLQSRPELVAALPPREAALVRARALQRKPWPLAAREAGHASAREAMRALRRAMRTLVPAPE